MAHFGLWTSKESQVICRAELGTIFLKFNQAVIHFT